MINYAFRKVRLLKTKQKDATLFDLKNNECDVDLMSPILFFESS